MNEIIDQVQLIIGGDSSQAVKALQDVTKQIDNNVKHAGNTGKQTGDAYGRGFAQAQDRWLRVAEMGLRKFGLGPVANLVRDFQYISRAMESTKRFTSGPGRTGGPNGGVGPGGLAAAVAAEAGLDLAMRPRLAKSAYKNYAEMFSSGVVVPLPGTKLPTNKLNSFISKVGSFFGKNIGLSSFGGATLGGLGGVGAGLGIMSLGADASKKKEELAEKMEGFKNLREEIERIKDPIERAARILKEFGADGLVEYRNLTEEVKKYTEETINSSGALRTWQYSSGLVIADMKEAWGDLKDFFLGAYVYPVSRGLDVILEKIGLVSSKDLDKLAGSEADLKWMQKNRDKQLLDGIKKKEEAEKQAKKDLEEEYKAQEDLVEEREKYKDAVQKSYFEEKKSSEQLTELLKQYHDLNAALQKVDENSALEVQFLNQQLDVTQKIKKLREDMAKDTITSADKNKFSLGDLSKMNTPAGRKAQGIMTLEDQRRLDFATYGSNYNSATDAQKKAFALRDSQIELGRRELGKGGFLQSDEFTVGNVWDQYQRRVMGPGGKEVKMPPIVTLGQLAKDFPQLKQSILGYEAISKMDAKYPGNTKYKDALEYHRNLIDSQLKDLNNNNPLLSMAAEFVRQGALPVKAINSR